jgi:hypothetical protein
MSARERIDGFLGEVAKQSGTPLRLEDNGTCRIRVDGKREAVVEAHDNAGLVFLHAAVQSLSGVGDREKAYRAALSMALFGVGTGGCVLGYDEVDDQLVLSLSRSVDELDAAKFVTLFGNFIEIAGKVGDGLAEAAHTGDVPARGNRPVAPHLRA